MSEYKFYCLDHAGHILRRHDIEAADDVAALERAQEMCGEHPIEIWQGARFMTHVAADGTTSKYSMPVQQQTG